MASSAKRLKVHHDETSVSGFIHSVSAIQLSRRTQTPYFNFVVQTTRKEFHRGVAYSPEKHASFQQAATLKSPVKLQNVRKSLSKFTFH